MISSFELLSETTVYQNPFFSVIDRHFRLPDGSEHHFYVKNEVDTCCVLAKTKEGFFIAVKEFRVGPQEVLVELPAGRLDNEEDDPDEHIQKELLQETGYAGLFKKVGIMPSSPYSTRKIHVYYASDCQKVAEQSLDETEFIEALLLSEDEMKEVLMEGKSSSCGPGLLAWNWMGEEL